MRKAFIALTLIAASLVPTHANAATAKAGATCTKLKATQVVGSKKFTCIKAGMKLIWDKGVTISKVAPKKVQEIDFPPIENRYLKESRIALTPGVTSGGLPVSIVGTGACSFDPTSLEIILNSLGTCSITDSQPGNAIYLPAPSITRTFEVLKLAQVIVAPEVSDQDLLKIDSYNFEFPKVGSEASFVVGTRDPAVCSAENNKVKFIKVGTCTLTFNKGADAYFEAAKEVTATFKIFKSAESANEPAKPTDSPSPKPAPVEPEHEGTVDDPQTFSKALEKNGVKIKIKGIKDDVSEFVCKTELIQDGCEFGGTVDADSYTRFTQIDISVENKGSESWIPSIFGLYLDDDLYGGDFIEDNLFLANYELPVGSSANLSLYVALDKEVKLTDCLLFISESIAEEAFYFKLK